MEDKEVVEVVDTGTEPVVSSSGVQPLPGSDSDENLYSYWVAATCYVGNSYINLGFAVKSPVEFNLGSMNECIKLSRDQVRSTSEENKNLKDEDIKVVINFFGKLAN